VQKPVFCGAAGRAKSAGLERCFVIGWAPMMHEFIDIYCERTGPELWAEPLNALSNAAFFVAFFFALQLARRKNVLDLTHGLLLALLLAIGVGSTLFHTLAVRWAMLADVIPILLFQLVFIPAYARRVIGWGAGRATALTGLFLLLSIGSGFFPAHWLNGSLSYLPALLFLYGLGIYHYRAGKAAPVALIAAAGIFTASIAFRSADMALCELLPIGVHYFWHILNGIVLYLALRALFLAGARRTDRAAVEIPSQTG